MNRTFRAGFLMLMCVGLSAVAQDWYHDRDTRFHGEDWRSHVFGEVKADLDHIGSPVWVSGKERTRLETTRKELDELQAKLASGLYDEHMLNDVIDSLVKSADDKRLGPRDRDVLSDDLNRLRDYRDHHDHWKR